MMLQASLQVRLRLDSVDELGEIRGFRFFEGKFTCERFGNGVR
jgi:hypothetical protein